MQTGSDSVASSDSVAFTLTQQDLELLRSLPLSVSRVLKEAATEIDSDGGVTAAHLLSLEPILNRLFTQAQESIQCK